MACEVVHQPDKIYYIQNIFHLEYGLSSKQKMSILKMIKLWPVRSNLKSKCIKINKPGFTSRVSE